MCATEITIALQGKTKFSPRNSQHFTEPKGFLTKNKTNTERSARFRREFSISLTLNLGHLRVGSGRVNTFPKKRGSETQKLQTDGLPYLFRSPN